MIYMKKLWRIQFPEEHLKALAFIFSWTHIFSSFKDSCKRKWGQEFRDSRETEKRKTVFFSLCNVSLPSTVQNIPRLCPHSRHSLELGKTWTQWLVFLVKRKVGSKMLTFEWLVQLVCVMKSQDSPVYWALFCLLSLNGKDKIWTSYFLLVWSTVILKLSVKSWSLINEDIMKR